MKETRLVQVCERVSTPREEVGYAPKVLGKKCVLGVHKKFRQRQYNSNYQKYVDKEDILGVCRRWK